MAVLSRIPLSASTSGKPISITSTSSPGTLLHLSSSATQIKDTLYLSLYNYATTPSIATVELCGTTTDCQIVMTLPPQDGVVGFLNGHTFNGGTATGSDGVPFVRMFATGSGRVSAFGYSDRAT